MNLASKNRNITPVPAFGVVKVFCSSCGRGLNMISSDRSVFSLRELSSDLKNRFLFLKLGIIFKNLAEGKDFLVKDYINIIYLWKLYFFFFFEIHNFFMISFWNKNFKRIGCAISRLLSIDHVEITSDRNSRSQMFFKTGDLKNSAMFARKHLCWSLFLRKLL